MEKRHKKYCCYRKKTIARPIYQWARKILILAFSSQPPFSTLKRSVVYQPITTLHEHFIENSVTALTNLKRLQVQLHYTK